MRSNQAQVEPAATRAGENASSPQVFSGVVAAIGKSDAQLFNAGSRRETIIESRLAKLGDRLAERVDTPFFTLMHDVESTESATDSIRDASERLTAEASALRWVLRIAKHSEGPVRARLWLDIDRALSALENLEMRFLGAQEKSQSVRVDTAHPTQANLQTRH